MIYIKRIIASLLFIVGLAGLLIGSSYVFMPKSGESEFGIEDASANIIKAEKENTIDVIIFGDSESYSNLTPMQIWKDSGIPVFICGTRAQPLNYTQVLVERAFKTQSPKVIFLETNTFYREVSMETSIMDMASNYFSIIMHHNRWKSIGFSGVNKTYADDYKGYQYSDECKPAEITEYMPYSEEIEEIPEVNVQYIEKIKELCEQNGAQLVFLSTPSIKNWNHSRHNAVAKLAEELDCEYLDLNAKRDLINIDWKTDTRDKGDHLNHKGAVKASAYLSAYLIEKGIFSDKRNNPLYSDWNEAFNRYELFVGQGT